MEWGSRLGSQLEEHVIGSTVEDPVENFVDGVLTHYAPADSQGYQPRTSYGRTAPAVRHTPPHAHTGT
jgi:hypothetical protein